MHSSAKGVDLFIRPVLGTVALAGLSSGRGMGEEANSMETRQCGRSDMRLSALAVGCWAFGGGEYWGDQDQNDVNAIVARAVDLGVNYFDTAEVYNDGWSEESLGEALKEVARDRVVIGTKIAPSNTEPDVLVKHCEASLRRLRTDRIDLYMVHWPITPISIKHFTDQPVLPSVPDAFATLMRLREQGKIRHIGVSNFGVAKLDEAMGTGAEIVANELPHSLLTRGIEWEILPYCREKNVGAIGYMALLQGVLADIYPTLDDVHPWQQRTRHFDSRRPGSLCRHGEEGVEEETNRALGAIRAVARDCGMTVPELAVKWAVAAEGVTSVLVGSRNVKELEQNVRAASEPLDPDIVRRLNAATEEVKRELGPHFDYYEGAQNDRTA